MLKQMRIAISGVSGDVGFSALVGIRDEHRTAWILGIDSSEDCAGFALVDVSVKAPYVTDPLYLNFLIDTLNRHEINLLIPGIDSEIPLLAKERERIENETGCKVVVADTEFVNICSDKLETAQWLRSLGFPAPETWDVDSTEEAALRGLDLPLIAKPRVGNGSKGVLQLRETTDLQSFVDNSTQNYCLQALVEGPEYTCSLLFNDYGIICDWIYMKRELLNGRTVLASTENVETIDHFIKSFSQSVAVRGAINLQLRLGSDGVPYVFEINPRLSGSSIMRIAVGFNDPARIVWHWLGEQNISKAIIRQATVYIATAPLVVRQAPSFDTSKRPKDIVFDCGDTILELYPARELTCRDVLRELGVNRKLAEIRKAYELVDFSGRQNASQLPNHAAKSAFFDEYNHRLAIALGIESVANEFNIAMQRAFSKSRHWIANSNTKFFLENIQDKYNCYVLANWDENLDKVLDNADVLHFFRQTYSSKHLGSEKPSPEIFQRFLAASGVNPQEAFYIGNEYFADAVGSRNAGFTPILIDRYGTLPEEIDCHRISSWSQLNWLIT